MPLNATGVAQAAAAAQLLQRRGIASIVTSPLSRARDTALAAGAVLGLPITVETDLQEVSFGVHEGMAMSGAWFDEWVTGGSVPQGGESFAALRSRAAAGLTQALAHSPPVLVVAHGAWFRALRAEMGLEPNVRTPNALPLFCEPGDPWVLTAAT